MFPDLCYVNLLVVNLIINIKQGRSVKNILYLTTVIPNYKTGGEFASQAFIEALRLNDCNVTVLAYNRVGEIHHHYDQIVIAGFRYIETDKARWYPLWWMVKALLKNRPYTVEKFYSNGYLNQLRNLLSINTYHAVVIEHSQMGWLSDHIPKSIPIILNTQNIENEIYRDHEQSSSGINRLIYRRESFLLKRIEDKTAKRATQVWTLTDHDAQYFSSCTGTSKVRIFAVPSRDILEPSIKSISKSCDLGIIGTWTWKANHDGLRWFFDQVYPLLPETLSINVAGRGAEWLIDKYANVHYGGFVPDAQEFMASCRLLAIPAVSGGGMQIKTLEAIASGALIVATPFALRGISSYPQSVHICENKVNFATKVSSLLASLPSVDLQGHQWSVERRKQFYCDVANCVNQIS